MTANENVTLENNEHTASIVSTDVDAKKKSHIFFSFVH